MIEIEHSFSYASVDNQKETGLNWLYYSYKVQSQIRQMARRDTRTGLWLRRASKCCRSLRGTLHTSCVTNRWQQLYKLYCAIMGYNGMVHVLRLVVRVSRRCSVKLIKIKSFSSFLPNRIINNIFQFPDPTLVTLSLASSYDKIDNKLLKSSFF